MREREEKEKGKKKGNEAVQKQFNMSSKKFT
jgi:hypothetical protein